MLNMASGQRSHEHPEGHLKPIDLSHCLAVREARSKRDNPVFSLGLKHRFFGASNASLMYDVVQGDVQALRTILHEERFPEGFETRFVLIPPSPLCRLYPSLFFVFDSLISRKSLHYSVRQRFGYTMKDFHMRSLEIYLGITPPDLPAGDIKTTDAIKRAAAENGRFF
jgi:Peroxidase, family 2